MIWWAYVILGLYALGCFILIIAVLLQPGKSDAAALFGGGASQTAFGPRGTQNFLGYVTIGCAVTFMGLGLLMSIPGVLGPSSVVRSVSDKAPAVPPPPPPANPTAPIEVKTNVGGPVSVPAPTTSDKAAKPEAKKGDTKSKSQPTTPAKPPEGKP